MSESIQYKLEIYLPKEFIEPIMKAVTDIGGCKVGDYDHIASYYPVEGCWRPLESSTPVTGKKNLVNYGTEYKLEIRCDESLVQLALDRIRGIHPYEEVLINIIRLDNHLFI